MLNTRKDLRDKGFRLEPMKLSQDDWNRMKLKRRRLEEVGKRDGYIIEYTAEKALMIYFESHGHLQVLWN